MEYFYFPSSQNFLTNTQKDNNLYYIDLMLEMYDFSIDEMEIIEHYQRLLLEHDDHCCFHQNDCYCRNNIVNIHTLCMGIFDKYSQENESNNFTRGTNFHEWIYCK